MVIVGADRVTAGGDVCNKVGTYLKALAARDNRVPLYAAMPVSTIDWSIESGADIPIEERSASELIYMTGRAADGSIARVQVVPDDSPALNIGFDVTPARLITALITERGLCVANRAALRDAYADHCAVYA
jgi:methylthioribose-1-phosphate isomerase